MLSGFRGSTGGGSQRTMVSARVGVGGGVGGGADGNTAASSRYVRIFIAVEGFPWSGFRGSSGGGSPMTTESARVGVGGGVGFGLGLLMWGDSEGGFFTGTAGHHPTRGGSRPGTSTLRAR